MGDGEFHVVRQRLAALGVFLGNHVENVVKFVLRLFRRFANRVAAVNRRNVGDVTPVVVPMANDVIIEECFHGDNLAHEPDGWKWKKLFSADFEAERDGFLDVLERVRLGLALTDATGNGRTLGHPHSILVTVNRHRKFHGLDLTHGRMVGKRTSCVEL